MSSERERRVYEARCRNCKKEWVELRPPAVCPTCGCPSVKTLRAEPVGLRLDVDDELVRALLAVERLDDALRSRRPWRVKRASRELRRILDDRSTA